MITNKSLQSGFTAVELLITLFIASVFLFAGYQLFSQVTRDGATADKTARLSNILYERLRKKSAELTASGQACSTASETPAPPTPVTENTAGFGNVDYTTTVKCLSSTASTGLTGVYVIKIKASYSDAGTSREVEHATYASS